ncbi:hypothetical protein K491DRAFT_462500 [Lophiostoma macrostomum CBS 122681]|uniref:Uncharacterized protein n=1 Tax=Lophiostoma macrostomum CBS 122681 TaxID=1314788 RepID=A0A6A6T7Z3_9PLEO|nr:hypothetical protein K491DRAFT_462500 [Lophiostoma macrostomum CBS 122681]
MPLDWNTSESAMDYADRPNNQPFLDLRSARRARNRARANLEKYNHFRRPGLTRGDIPSFEGPQQSHYLPICYLPGCPTSGTADGCWLNVFPADLSTAPIAKFTKREAYQDAQLWPRPPTYHRSGGRRRGANMKSKQKSIKDMVGEELRAREWYDDIESFKCQEEVLRDMTMFARYCCFRQHADWFESEEDDLRDGPGDPTHEEYPNAPVETDNEKDEGYCSSAEDEASNGTTTGSPSGTQPAAGTEERDAQTPDTSAATSADHTIVSDTSWYWHRNFAGGWYRARYSRCCWYTCACTHKWYDPHFSNGESWDNEPRATFSLGEWLHEKLEHAYESTEPTMRTEALSDSLSDDDDFQAVWGSEYSGQLRQDAGNEVNDWDMLSDISDAWTEV